MTKSVPCRDRTDECMRAAFENAMVLIDGGEAAGLYWHRILRVDRQELRRMDYRTWINTIRKLSSYEERTVGGIELQHVRLKNGDRLWEPRLDFFTMKGSDDLLHSICVDSREGEGFIYDSSEPYALQLSDRSLKLCVRDYVCYRGMTELRQFVRSASRERVEENRNRPSCSERKERKHTAEGTSK